MSKKPEKNGRTAARDLCIAILALIALPGLSRASITDPVPDLLEVTESSALRWNMNSPGTVYNRSAGTTLFGGTTRMNDGSFVTYRNNYNGATPALFQINPNTGVMTSLVQSTTAAGRVLSMVAMPDGTLFGYDSTQHFVSIDPTLLAYTLLPMVASNGTHNLSCTAMATAPNGDIYGWGIGTITNISGICSELYKLNPATGTAQEIGGYIGAHTDQSFLGMAFAPDGRLFGFTDLNGASNGALLVANGIYQIDPQTGLTTLLTQRTELTDTRGIAFLPIPEPGSACLLAIATVPLFLGRRPQHKHR